MEVSSHCISNLLWHDSQCNNCSEYQRQGWCYLDVATGKYEIDIAAHHDWTRKDQLQAELAARRNCCECGGGSPNRLDASLVMPYFAFYVACVVLRRTWVRIGRKRKHMDPQYTASKNYQTFLKHCCLIFILLTLFAMVQHGTIRVLWVGATMRTLGAGRERLVVQEILVIVKGLLVLAVVQRWKHTCNFHVPDAYSTLLNRTVWFSNIPTNDAAWKFAPCQQGQKFQLDPRDDIIMKRDLTDALNKEIQKVLESDSLDNDSDADTRTNYEIESSRAATARRGGPERTFRRHSAQRRANFLQDDLPDKPRPPRPRPKASAQATRTSSGASAVSHASPQPSEPLTVLTLERTDSQDDGGTTGGHQDNGSPEKSCVERIHIPYKSDGWYAAAYKLMDARERLTHALDQYHRAVVMRQQNPDRREDWRFQDAVILAQRRAKRLQEVVDRDTKELDGINKEKKELCGSAFVTFKNITAKRAILGKSNSYWPRRHNFFSFGRPPFATCTLHVRRSPHPTNIVWANLHVTQGYRRCLCLMHLLLLFVTMFVLSTSTVVMGTAYNLSEETMTHMGLLNNSSDAVWNPGGDVASGQSRLEQVQQGLLALTDTFATLLSVLVNTLILQNWIYGISWCIRPTTQTQAEVFQLHWNLLFLLLNQLVFPLFGVVGMRAFWRNFEGFFLGPQAEWRDWACDQKLNHVQTEDWIYILLTDAPVAILNYLISATMVTNGTALLQLAQRFYRAVFTKFQLSLWLEPATTKRDFRDALTPFPFPWGFWYAWSLSNVAAALFLSEVIPSVLPLMVIYFILREYADRNNLLQGLFEQGVESEGLYSIHVAMYLRLITALWWFVMGMVFLHMSGKADASAQEHAFIGSLVLIIGAAVFLLWAVLDYFYDVAAREFGEVKADTSSSDLADLGPQGILGRASFYVRHQFTEILDHYVGLLGLTRANRYCTSRPYEAPLTIYEGTWPTVLPLGSEVCFMGAHKGSDGFKAFELIVLRDGGLGPYYPPSSEKTRSTYAEAIKHYANLLSLLASSRVALKVKEVDDKGMVTLQTRDRDFDQTSLERCGVFEPWREKVRQRFGVEKCETIDEWLLFFKFPQSCLQVRHSVSAAPDGDGTDSQAAANQAHSALLDKDHGERLGYVNRMVLGMPRRSSFPCML